MQTIEDLKNFTLTFLVDIINSSTTSYNQNKLKIVASKIILDYTLKSNRVSPIRITNKNTIVAPIQEMSEEEKMLRMYERAAKTYGVTLDEAKTIIDKKRKEAYDLQTKSSN